MPKQVNKLKKLRSELKSLNKEVKSLNAATKTTARDVASVTKSLKNAKKISKAAKSANAKITDGDINRLSNSIQRQKQVSKLVSKMTGTFTKRDVNAIERSLLYGKELAKLSRSLAGKIGAKEIRILNKTLADAREAKRITNSLTGKSATGIAKPLKKVASNSATVVMAAPTFDSNISQTLTGILVSVSAIPKMAQNIETSTKVLQSEATKKKTEEFKTLELKNELEQKRKIVAKEYTSKEQKKGAGGLELSSYTSALISRLFGGSLKAIGVGGLALSSYKFLTKSYKSFTKAMALISRLFGGSLKAIGVGGLVLSSYKSLSPESQKVIDDAIKQIFNYVVDQAKKSAINIVDGVKKSASEVTETAKEFIQNPSAETANKLGEKTKKLANPETTAALRVLAPPLASVSSVVSGVGDVLTGIEKREQLDADTKFSAGMGSFFGGQEDDPVLLRMFDKAIMGATVGSLLGPWGTMAGGLAGAYGGYVGPQKAAKQIDTASFQVDKTKRSLTELYNLLKSESSTQARLRIEREKKDLQYKLNALQQSRFTEEDDLIGDLFGLNEQRRFTPEQNKEYESKKKELLDKISAKDKELAQVESNSDRAIVESQRKIKAIEGETYKDWRKKTYGYSTPETSDNGYGENKITPELLTALVMAESNMNPRALSSAGAMGLTQLMPGTAKSLNVKNPFDPKQSLTGGLTYLNQMLKQFGSVDAALAAYNVGPGAFAGLSGRAGSTDVNVIANTLGIGDSFGGMGQIPQQTVDYVPKVKELYLQIKAGKWKENLEYVQNTLGKEVFESAKIGQNTVVSNSFNTTTVVQGSQPQTVASYVPESLGVEQFPQY